MESKQPKDKDLRIQEWLEKLQYQSWQLELLISGFSIALLLRMYDPLKNFLDDVLLYAPVNPVLNVFFNFISLFGTTAWFFLTVNLILLVVIRGLWIGTIGLRTLSSKINLEKMHFSEAFEQKLQNKLPSYDHYVEQLDQICSIIFAFTFLTILILFSFGLTLLVFMTVKELFRYVSNLLGWDQLYAFLRSLWIIFFSLGGFLYALDFFTLGWVKKHGFLFRFYYPIYTFFSLITAAKVYRPLYYNLIGTRGGRMVAFAIFPYFIFIYFTVNVDVFKQRYFSYQLNGGFLAVQYYEDERTENKRAVSASIPSRIVSQHLMPLFIRYEPKQDDPAIALKCPDLVHGSLSLIPVWAPEEAQQTAERKLECLSGLVELYINDSMIVSPTFHFYEHPQTKDPGLTVLLDLDMLPRGEHRLKVNKYHLMGEAEEVRLISTPVAQIPFWIP